ncbi:MAG: hypothetical protein JOZ53_18265 [Planctomycetaceae bacterium]|nr:hypothetical protein [Planctomycetaceae bacterium]
MLILYTTLLNAFYRARFGAPPDLSADGDGDCRGLVLVADGCGGLELCGMSLRYVMGAMRAPHAVRLVPWGHGFGRWHADLTNVANREAKGRVIADEVATFRAGHPGAPVFLVGKSGGSGLMIRALELLPVDVVERVVLLSPAVSPTYDLSRALHAVRREMVVFWSPLDVIFLGLGTRVFGTIDRVRTVSAGLVGFRVPGGLDAPARAPYAKLRQVRWRPAMARTWYFGGHLGPDGPAFLKKYVVPLLQVAEGPAR